MSISGTPKITAQLLAKTKPENWHELYVEQGEEMLALAANLLAAKDKKSITLGLAIIGGAFIEEDFENLEPTLKDLNFQIFIKPLENLLGEKEHAQPAVYALWVCCREGANVKALDTGPLEKLMGSSDTSAFRVLVHVLCQNKKAKDLLTYSKGDLKTALFGELTAYAARKYDIAALLPIVLEGLTAAGDSAPFESVEILWNLLTVGADISSAIPVLIKHQAHLAGFTDAMKVIAGYYIREKKFDALKQSLASPDKDAQARMYRGVLMAAQSGLDVSGLKTSKEIQTQLAQVAEKNSLPNLDLDDPTGEATIEKERAERIESNPVAFRDGSSINTDMYSFSVSGKKIVTKTHNTVMYKKLDAFWNEAARIWKLYNVKVNQNSTALYCMDFKKNVMKPIKTQAEYQAVLDNFKTPQLAFIDEKAEEESVRVALLKCLAESRHKKILSKSFKWEK